jgi:hypothetical protein
LLSSGQRRLGADRNHLTLVLSHSGEYVKRQLRGVVLSIIVAMKATFLLKRSNLAMTNLALRRQWQTANAFANSGRSLRPQSRPRCARRSVGRRWRDTVARFALGIKTKTRKGNCQGASSVGKE